MPGDPTLSSSAGLRRDKGFETGFRTRVGCSGCCCCFCSLGFCSKSFDGSVELRNRYLVRVADHVLAGDRQGDGVSELRSVFSLDSQHELAVGVTAVTDEAQVDGRGDQGTDVLPADCSFGAGVPLHQCAEGAVVVGLGGVQLLQDASMSLGELKSCQLCGDEVAEGSDLISTSFSEKSTFSTQACFELRCRKGRELTDHREVDGGVADCLDHCVEGGVVVAVEAQDEPGVDQESCAADLLDLCLQVLDPGVLALAGLLDRGRVRGLDSEKDGLETSFFHRRHELWHLGEPDVRFGHEGEGEVVLVLPHGDGADRIRS